MSPTDEDRCEGLAPFRCGNPDCPAHGLLRELDKAAEDWDDLPEHMKPVGGSVDFASRVIPPVKTDR